MGIDLRLECLRLAAQTMMVPGTEEGRDVVAMAERYFAFVSGQKESQILRDARDFAEKAARDLAEMAKRK